MFLLKGWCEFQYCRGVKELNYNKPECQTCWVAASVMRTRPAKVQRQRLAVCVGWGGGYKGEVAESS